jgi:hypothetical protein
MAAIEAAELAQLMNGYTIESGPPKSISLANASKIAALGIDVTVTGELLKRQLVHLTPPRRTAGHPPRHLPIETNDGDLHFGVGAAGADPDDGHTACELQRAKPWLDLFNHNIGNPIETAGFFRCLFEHPGFHANYDAHIFELHPIRAVSLAGGLLSFDVSIPDQDSIHNWGSQSRNLTLDDQKTTVAYDQATDTLTLPGHGRNGHQLRPARRHHHRPPAERDRDRPSHIHPRQPRHRLSDQRLLPQRQRRQPPAQPPGHDDRAPKHRPRHSHRSQHLHHQPARDRHPPTALTAAGKASRKMGAVAGDL